MALLPLQQQNALKKIMESRFPNIDVLVTQAGRQEWVRQAQAQDQLQEQYQGSSTVHKREVYTDVNEDYVFSHVEDVERYGIFYFICR